MTIAPDTIASLLDTMTPTEVQESFAEFCLNEAHKLREAASFALEKHTDRELIKQARVYERAAAVLQTCATRKAIINLETLRHGYDSNTKV